MESMETGFMQRCLDLAISGRMRCRPNPMVGAVLVYEGRIIGEGFHEVFGGPHAEVNCLRSVSAAEEALIPLSTLYVSLEPCCHHGKTPPCTDLIIASGIRQVVIGCLDRAAHVNGQGMAHLREAGIEVKEGVLEDACLQINRRFFTHQLKQRPYVILKWAQSADGFIAREHERTSISNRYTQHLVHRWRAEESAIWVGYRTALIDNPQLSVRMGRGPNPLRVVFDREASLPSELQLFSNEAPTLWFTLQEPAKPDGRAYIVLNKEQSILPQILQDLHRRSIDSVLVEGGAALHQQFFAENTWDELRVIRSSHSLGGGVASPRIPATAKFVSQQQIDSDTIDLYVNSSDAL